MLAQSSVQKLIVSICFAEVLTVSYFAIAPLPEIIPPKVSLPKRADILQGTPFFMPPPSDTFSSINDRPLFNPQRTPLKSDVLPSGGSGTEAIPSVVVVGVLLDRHTKMAFLKSQNTMFATTVEVGSVLDGWEVTDIAEDHVTIRNGSTEHEIPLNSVRTQNPATGMNIPSAPKPQTNYTDMQVKPITDQTKGGTPIKPPFVKSENSQIPPSTSVIPAPGNDPQVNKN